MADEDLPTGHGKAARPLDASIDRTARTYDDLPYQSRPFAETHPARSAAIARFFGLEAPPVARARVLELGCAAGGNLIPLAAYHPQGRFLGVDLGARQIAEGKERIARAGLANIELRRQSLTELGAEEGCFDYIICHGVYSWVPPQVRDAILRICRENLAPEGIAYVSFNVSPGWCLYQPLREAFRSLIPETHDAATRVGMARNLLDLMKRHAPDKGPYGDMLRAAPARLAGHGDDYLYHEYMEEVNAPCTITEFLAAASEAGLGYLGDSHIQMMLPETFGTEFAQALRGATTNDVASQEQMIDVMTGRTFRQTLLIHEERMAHIDRRLVPARLAGLHIVGPKGLALRSEGGAVTLSAEAGRTMSSREAAVGPAMERLVGAYPASIAYDDLLEGLAGRDREVVAESVYRLVIAGIVDISAEPVALGDVGDRPRAAALARCDAAAGSRFTANRRHEAVRLDPGALELLPRLDGGTGHEALEAALFDAARANRLSFRYNNVAVTEPRQLRDAIRKLLPDMLRGLAASGLIEP